MNNHPPPPSLYRGGGMNIRVRPRVKSDRCLADILQIAVE